MQFEDPHEARGEQNTTTRGTREEQNTTTRETSERFLPYGFPCGWKMSATSEMHLAHGFAWPHSRHQDLFGLWVEVKTIFETTLGGNWQGETRSETSYSGHLADSRLKPTSRFSLGITLKAPVASTKTEAIKELRSHCWLKGVTKSMKNSPLLRDALTRVRSVLELHDEAR